MTAARSADLPREVAFAPAVEDAKVAPGTGFLQPGGLVVHTGWSYPLQGERVLHQHPAYEGASIQPWNISTPDGRRAACFPYLTRPDAEQAAARIAAALPAGAWSADGGSPGLLDLAREASTLPPLLPLAHNGKPAWGSGYGSDLADFYLPTRRDAYERMIAAHGQIPKNCQCCARLVREQKRLGWRPRTNHWPVWRVHGHRGDLVRPHCYCMTCMRLDFRMGTYGTVTDEHGHSEPASCVVYPWREQHGITDGVERSQLPFTWFTHLLNEGGCVVLDERPGVNLWPQGVRHDDAAFCETGVTGSLELDLPGRERRRAHGR